MDGCDLINGGKDTRGFREEEVMSIVGSFRFH